MAKCTRCTTRKGKRHCPALSADICARCCADGRLKTIQCPQDCPHLGGEMYQHKRRQERASSRGRTFLETSRKLFPKEEVFNFIFKIQADIYYFLENEMATDDASVANSLDVLKSLYSPIFVPDSSSHPLTRFLQERLEDPNRYPEDGEPGKEGRMRALRDLARHVASLGDESSPAGSETYRYREILSEFFSALDFEADLDYSPLDAPARQSPGGAQQRSPGGLILPP